MDEATREEYLAEVRRKGSTIGASLPEQIEIGGDELELDEFLIETRKLDAVPKEATAKIKEAREVLETERNSRLGRLETESIDEETARLLVDEINGIDRALNALDNIRHPNYGQQSQSQLIEDHKRWLGFVDQINR